MPLVFLVLGSRSYITRVQEAHSLSCHLSPTVIVLVNPHAFAPFDACKEPGSDNFGGGVFETFHVIEKLVINELDERRYLAINLCEVLDKTAGVNLPSQNNVETIVVSV
jgi:hypothetical protein